MLKSDRDCAKARDVQSGADLRGYVGMVASSRARPLPVPSLTSRVRCFRPSFVEREVSDGTGRDQGNPCKPALFVDTAGVRPTLGRAGRRVRLKSSGVIRRCITYVTPNLCKP